MKLHNCDMYRQFRDILAQDHFSISTLVSFVEFLDAMYLYAINNVLKMDCSCPEMHLKH